MGMAAFDYSQHSNYSHEKWFDIQCLSLKLFATTLVLTLFIWFEIFETIITLNLLDISMVLFTDNLLFILLCMMMLCTMQVRCNVQFNINTTMSINRIELFYIEIGLRFIYCLFMYSYFLFLHLALTIHYSFSGSIGCCSYIQ